MTFYEHHKPEPPKRNRRNGNGAAHAEAPAEVNLVCMSEVTPRPIDWLWLGRLARRKLTLITGDPDLGKSQNWPRHDRAHYDGATVARRGRR